MLEDLGSDWATTGLCDPGQGWSSLKTLVSLSRKGGGCLVRSLRFLPTLTYTGYLFCFFAFLGAGRGVPCWARGMGELLVGLESRVLPWAGYETSWKGVCGLSVRGPWGAGVQWGGGSRRVPGQSEVDYSEHCRRVMVGMTGSVDGS